MIQLKMTLKPIFVQLILCLTFLDCCYGQSTEKLIDIPVLKENVKVDAALDKFIAQRPKNLEKLSRLGGGYQDGAIKTLLKDSCLLVQLYNSDSLNKRWDYCINKSQNSYKRGNKYIQAY